GPARAHAHHHRVALRPPDLLPFHRLYTPPSSPLLLHAPAPPLRPAGVDDRAAPAPAPHPPAGTHPDPALRRLRLLQSCPGRMASPAALQSGHGSPRRAHRPAPHDHGGLGDPVVARALAVGGVAPRALSRAHPLSLPVRAAHGGGLDLHLHGP